MILQKSKDHPFLGFLLFIISLILTIEEANSQVSSDKQQHIELSDALEGSFQFQMINHRSQPAYNTDLLEKISNKQKQNERVSFFYKGNIRILILSKNEIQNGITFSQDEKVIYVNQ